MSNSCIVDSIRESKARTKAAELVKNGYPVGIFNRGVCAIWGNGESKKFCDSVAQIKGELRKKKALAATFPTELLVQLIDSTMIPSKLHHIFLDANELSERIGSLCFVRVPVTYESAQKLPWSMVSKMKNGCYVIQNWDPAGHKPTELFIQELHSIGVKYPAVTSMNISGKPEIVDQDAGIQFARNANIPIFLKDELDTGRALGSYTIFNINRNGIELVRNGNIPWTLFHSLFGVNKIRNMRSKSPIHPQLDLSGEALSNLSPKEARIAIISSIQQY